MKLKVGRRKYHMYHSQFFYLTAVLKNNVSFEFDENLIDDKSLQSLMSSQLENLKSKGKNELYY